jgi:hypothetical protein
MLRTSSIAVLEDGIRATEVSKRWKSVGGLFRFLGDNMRLILAGIRPVDAVDCGQK